MRHWQVVAMAGLAALAGAGPAWSQQAGVAAAVRGQVEIAERSGAVGRLVKSGEPIFLGNAIKSGADSGLQIMLLDETTFTIGPNSELTIDEFVFDPKTSLGKVSASVAKGVFRFVTGKVAREQPGNMQVKLPAGTIGIRGTIAMGRVDQVNQNGTQTDRQQVILVGPGQNTEANRIGGLELSAGGGGTSITQPGFGSTLLGRGQWGPAERFDPAVIAEIAMALRRSFAPQQQGEGQQAGAGVGNAGQSTNDAMLPLATLDQITSQTVLSNAIVADASQPTGAQVVSANILNGASSYEQLRTVNTGQFYWTQSNVAMSGSSLTSYNLFLDINFGKRVVGGGESRVELNNGNAGTVLLGQINYAGLSGPAAFNYVDTASVSSPSCGSSCTVRVNATPINVGGVAGQVLGHSVTVRNSTDTATVSTGGGTTGTRTVGSSPPGGGF